MCEVIKYQEQKYSMENTKIEEVYFSDTGDNTEIGVRYQGSKKTESVFIVPNKESILDAKILSELYVEIMTVNRRNMNVK